jgi:hypothetical protein
VQVRRRVIQALVEQTTPDTRSAALIALLHTIELEPKIVDPRRYGVSKHQLVRRGEQIANSNWAPWAPEAVRNSIDAIIAATRKEALVAGEGGGGG